MADWKQNCLSVTSDNLINTDVDNIVRSVEINVKEKWRLSTYTYVDV